MAFTWVDWAIIAIIAVSSLISLSRGFVKEALSLLTWIVAGVVAWMFGGALSQQALDDGAGHVAAADECNLSAHGVLRGI